MWCYNHGGIEATAICPVCRRALCEACATGVPEEGMCDNCAARAADHPQFAKVAPAKLVPGNCYQHEYTPASVFCARCARPMCRGCARPVRGRYACADCVASLQHDYSAPRPVEWIAAVVILVVLVAAYVYLRSLGLL